MNERDALLKAVCEYPDDDTPRLVFADWLQEHGEDDRAEFIRVQIEQTKLEPRTVPWWKCYSRARKLFTSRGWEWCEEIHPDRSFRWDEFVRGFAESVRVPAFESFEQFADRVFSRTPLKTLRIQQPVRLPELCRVPPVLRLSILEIAAGDATPEETRRFLAAVGEDGPTVLVFSDRITRPEVLSLLTAHFGARLMHPEDGYDEH